MSETYEVLVVLEDGSDPLVYVVSPHLRRYKDEPVPHVFPHQLLCLWLDDEWGPWAALADTVLPWTVEWLFYYEVWTVTGDWLGGGVHPNGAGRRDASGNEKRRARDRNKDRLTAGLRQAYGPDADLEVLLRNAAAGRRRNSPTSA